MSILDIESVNELLNKRDEAKAAYYESSEPIMTDDEYNELDSELSAMGYPEAVGTDKDAKVDHECPMPSLKKENIEWGKEFSEENYQNVISHFSNGRPSVMYRAELKYDGVAVELVYENGEFKRAVTRGNKLKGRDVTYSIKKLVPKTIADRFVISIRCEVVVTKETFLAKYEPEGKAHPRTTAAGILRDENLENENVYDLRLIPEDKVYRSTNGEFYSVAIQEGEEYGKYFIKPVSVPFEMNFENLLAQYKHLLSLRENFVTQIDGMVVKKIDKGTVFEFNGHDVYNAISIKFPSPKITSRVNGIKWNINKQGFFWPKVTFDPVEMDGRMIKQANGYNARYLLDRRVGVGALVEVEIRGDIIPAITKVLEPSDYDISKTYPKDSILGEVHLLYTKSDLVKKIMFAQGMLSLKIRGVGISIATLCAEKLNMDITQLFNPSNRFEFLTPANRETVMDSIKVLKKELTIQSAINMLGLEGMGGKLSVAIARHRSGLEADFSRTNSKFRISALEGEYKNKIDETIETLKGYGVNVVMLEDEVYENPLIRVVMTESPSPFGFETKDEFVAAITRYTIKDMGSKVKMCDYLICKNKDANTGKLKDARKNGIKILTYGEAYELFSK